jgi:16S rRNA (guanine1207-N2)-methyltransferase
MVICKLFTMPAKLPSSLDVIRQKARAPLAIVLGSPAEAARIVAGIGLEPIICCQMDVYQAERLRDALAGFASRTPVRTVADLWDLPGHYETVLYPVPPGGERSLKIDVVEQAFHLLRPSGNLVVASPFARDTLFPSLIKKVLGSVHATRVTQGTVFWCQRTGERPRRRHEVVFHARIAGGPTCIFLSRPGVFSHGEMDEGARALMETTEVKPGESIVDLGCGCGTNGVFAGLASMPSGSVLFVDSNLRAVALAEHNARRNGLTAFETMASADLKDLPDSSFDLALANPPYYARGTIARLFVCHAHRVLKPGGRLSLVSKQIDLVSSMVEEVFSAPRILTRRGYTIFQACKI